MEVGMASSNLNSAQLWSIILAGGEGKRMTSMVHRWMGRPIPKQYCAFVGTRSMFQHTLDRATRLTPPNRIVTVVAHSHRPEGLAQLDGRGGSMILFQPANRDTAAGVFLPLTYIRARDPQATVVLYPSDHFVYPENRFLEVVRRAVRIAESRPDRVVMLGVAPDRLELDYGWIQLGQSIADLPDGPVRAVRSFLEKPNAAQADAALRTGALWNTLVFAANIDLLWTLGWQCVPDMMPLFERLSEAIGGPEEGRVLEAIYRDIPAKAGTYCRDAAEDRPATSVSFDLSRPSIRSPPDDCRRGRAALECVIQGGDKHEVSRHSYAKTGPESTGSPAAAHRAGGAETSRNAALALRRPARPDRKACL
jgi:mannose-1-phosphate guanylyltransferase